MTSDQSSSEREPVAGDGTFERLDALSRPLAELVLQRAIELHHDEMYGPEHISREKLDQIAAELGIGPAYVHRALLEELEARQSMLLSARERVWAPDRISAGRIVSGDKAAVERAVIDWIRREEGFRPRARTRNGYTWERDDNWTTKLQLSLGGRSSSKALRSLKTVTHRQTDLGDRQLVELDVDTSLISKIAMGLAGGFAAIGTLGGALVASAEGGSDVAQFMAAFVPTTAVGGAASLIVAKTWAASVREGVKRALDGIAHPELRRRSRRGRDRRTGLSRVLGDIADTIDDLFD